MWRELKFIIPVILIPTVVAVPLWLGGGWTLFSVLFVFGLIPFGELFLSGTTENLTKEEEQEERKKRSYDYLLYLLVPIQFGLVIYYGFRITTPNLVWYEYIGMTLALKKVFTKVATNNPKKAPMTMLGAKTPPSPPEANVTEVSSGFNSKIPSIEIKNGTVNVVLE